jgi:hypothetical protein
MDPIGGGCVVGSTGAVCEHCGNCKKPDGTSVPPTDYSKCNPNMVRARFLVRDNAWSGDCVTNPPGWEGVIRRREDQPPLPAMDAGRPWKQVLDEVGPPNRNPREQAVVDWIKARLP